MIVLTGASASGKTVVGNYLINNYGFKKFITTTTREMRIGEVNDVDYHFVSREEFEKRIKDDAFVEWVEYNGNYYGSQKSEIDDNKVLVIEANGLNSYIALNDPNIVTFFFDCDEEIRRKRMISRQDKIEDVERRLIKDKTLFDENVKKKADYIIDSSIDDIKGFGEQVIELYNKKKGSK